MIRHRRFTPLLALALIIGGCEGARNNSSWSSAQSGEPIKPSLTKQSSSPATTATGASAPSSTTAAASDRGVGPVDHVDITALDGARALKGAEVFTTKCSACHKLSERYIGPALAGVTERRTPEWILNMILNPENMIQQDPTAKALLAEYIAPMANQHLTRDEAESILAYFLQQDAAQPASAGTTSGSTAQPVANK